MRRNLRLDWRALALLGALLSIIIDWPGLVYAMPTILPPVAAITVEAAPTDTLNIMKNDKMLNFFPDATKNFETDHPYVHQKDSDKRNDFTANKPENNENLNSFSTTTTRTSHVASTTSTNDISAELTEKGQQQQPQQRRQTTIKEKQQVNENYNSISVKQLNDNKQHKEQEGITANHHRTHQQEEQQHEQQQQQLNSPTLESAVVEKVSLIKNTHNKNSAINTISLSKTTTTPSPTPSSSSSSSTTESSAKIQSTLMPTILADQSDDDDDEQLNLNNSHLTNTQDLINNFKFSSSHHMAILSRTERSIRTQSHSSISSSSSSGSNSRGSSVGGNGTLVRRSSDHMSVLKSKRLNNSRNLHHKNNLDRNERSTVSHLSGPSRKIQLYIKNRFIQLLPDGTVNGTQDEQCDYTILQRSTVEVGRIKIQGVATCLYLCMDPCGAVYGSKEFTDDCVFNESMEQHNYNTYSSTYNSNSRRKFYLALNRHGEPRKLQIPPSRSLGKLATYTNAIPETVPQERVEQLIAKNFGANRVKHGIRQLCDTGKPLIELIDSKNFKARPKCNPNNSNNNSNSKSTLSRNLDKENSLVNHNHNNNHQHTNNNGQVLNNVPVANDKNNLSSNSRSSSSSNSRTETNRNSSSSGSNSPSSIRISQNNGHISSSSNSNSKHTSSSNSHSNSDSSSTATNIISSISINSTAPQTSSHRGGNGGGKKAGKKRKCRRFENEEQHNCTTPLNRPTSFTKRGNQLGPLRAQKCQNLLLQQQQAGVTDIVLPPMCTKKGGPKKQQGNNRRGQGKNGLGTDGLGPNNRRGKKLNMNRGGGSGGAGGGVGGSGGKQAAKNQNNNNGGNKKKQKNSKRGGNNNANNSNNNKKNNKKSSSTTTTEKAGAAADSDQTSTTSTLRPKSWETTSLMPSTTLFENYDPHSETTSDRGDREQRNVRYSSSMEEYMDQSSEDTSAAEDPEDDDNDMENNDEDASYEDDSYVMASSSHIPYTAADTSHTPLTAGADDFLYYDQLDFNGCHGDSNTMHPCDDDYLGKSNLQESNNDATENGPYRIYLHLW